MHLALIDANFADRCMPGRPLPFAVFLCIEGRLHSERRQLDVLNTMQIYNAFKSINLGEGIFMASRLVVLGEDTACFVFCFRCHSTEHASAPQCCLFRAEADRSAAVYA